MDKRLIKKVVDLGEWGLAIMLIVGSIVGVGLILAGVSLEWWSYGMSTDMPVEMDNKTRDGLIVGTEVVDNDRRIGLIKAMPGSEYKSVIIPPDMVAVRFDYGWYILPIADLKVVRLK